MFSSVATFCAPIRINPCTALPSLLLRVRRSVLPTEWEERPPPRRVSLAACGLHFIQTILRRQMISVADTKTRDPGDFSSSSRKWRLPPLPRCNFRSPIGDAGCVGGSAASLPRHAPLSLPRHAPLSLPCPLRAALPRPSAALAPLRPPPPVPSLFLACINFRTMPHHILRIFLYKSQYWLV